jgi:hypothetical protein
VCELSVLEIYEEPKANRTAEEKGMILIYGFLICGGFFVLGFFDGINFERNRRQT